MSIFVFSGKVISYICLIQIHNWQILLGYKMYLGAKFCFERANEGVALLMYPGLLNTT